MTIPCHAKLLLLLALSSCIDVDSDRDRAGPGTGPDPGRCRDGTEIVIERIPPLWLYPGPFSVDNSSVGVAPATWRASGKVPDTASFAVPFRAADTLVGIGWDAHGGNTNKGLSAVHVYYQSPLGAQGDHLVEVARSSDPGRRPEWDLFEVDPREIHRVELDPRGSLWVTLGVEDDYQVGLVTATFARPCR